MRGGRVQVKGWTETTAEDAVALAKRADGMGVSTIIYTDTARDGMMEGVNTQAMDAICAAVNCSVIASGGITCAADMKALRGLKRPNLVGVIVGQLSSTSKAGRNFCLIVLLVAVIRLSLGGGII